MAHRGQAIDELVFDLIDGDLHHLPPPEPAAPRGMVWKGSSALLPRHGRGRRQSPETVPGSRTRGP